MPSWIGKGMCSLEVFWEEGVSCKMVAGGGDSCARENSYAALVLAGK